MRVWIHRYRLVPKRSLGASARPGPRDGALLRFGDGFADLHPWPELGDPPLDEQLAVLSRGGTTRQIAASMRLAAADADARRRGVSLFAGLTIPASHWPGSDPPAEFDTAKVKGAAGLPDRVRLRIDFNLTLSPQAFLSLAASLPRERIDFVEDPCPYDPATWRELRLQSGIPLALDRVTPAAGEAGFDLLVHKPALEVEFPRFEGEIVVTSYMDHPVGQFGAAWVAASRRVSSRCGLFTHVLYEPDPFVERVQSDGPRLRAPEGTGIGFDDLLEGIPWKTLS